MRDKRAIIIKSPKMQRIRNNLRYVFYRAANSKWNEVHDKMRGLLTEDDSSHKSLYDLSPSELKLFRDLQNQEASITDMINRSILSCVTCGNGKRDMVYNKAYDAWYCIECYGIERLSAQKRAKVKERSNKSKSCEEKVIESHSKTFL